MMQTAIFIDAGYLYAQGSALIAGAKQPRHKIRLSVPPMIVSLLKQAAAIEPDARLLRVYWYDGLARGGALNLEQRAVADHQNVKCRFGTINSRGEQKGVDSLIVTDLIELARSHAISDAVIMSGDEDIRIGVQVAQTFGIRVHLIGIHPARGSQSPDLIAESDTLTEWGKEQIQEWMSIVSEEILVADLNADEDDRADAVVSNRVATLTPQAALAIIEYANQNRNQLPQDFDRPSLAAARSSLGRELTNEERRLFRARLSEAVRAKASSSDAA